MHCDPLSCLPDAHLTPPTPPPFSAPPRVLILGASDSGKTTFLRRCKASSLHHQSHLHLRTPSSKQHKSVEAAFESNLPLSLVEELPITSKQSILFTDTTPDRRDFRLHFLTPKNELSLLYFLDTSLPLPELSDALEMLVYAVTYAQSHATISYIGIILNKQDLLPAAQTWDDEKGIYIRGRKERVAAVKKEVEEVMETVCAIAGEGWGERIDGRGRSRRGGLGHGGLRWEVLAGGEDGISAELGWGCEELFDRVCLVVGGVERGRHGRDSSRERREHSKERRVAHDEVWEEKFSEKPKLPRAPEPVVSGEMWEERYEEKMAAKELGVC